MGSLADYLHGDRTQILKTQSVPLVVIPLHRATCVVPTTGMDDLCSLDPPAVQLACRLQPFSETVQLINCLNAVLETCIHAPARFDEKGQVWSIPRCNPSTPSRFWSPGDTYQGVAGASVSRTGYHLQHGPHEPRNRRIQSTCARMIGPSAAVPRPRS